MKERSLGLLGFISAALAVVSDFALQYTPNLSHVGSPTYAYLLDVSPANLLLGHWLGVPAVFGEIAGFWFVSRQFAPQHSRAARVFLVAGTTAFALGGAFHAMFAPIGLALQQAVHESPLLVDAIARAVRPAHQALGVPVMLAILTYSCVFVWAALTRRTRYPQF